MDVALRLPTGIELFDKRMGSEKLKVMHLITTSEIGGAEIQLSRLLARMHHPAIQHSVVSLAKGGAMADLVQAHGARFYSLDMERGGLSLSLGPGILKLLALIRTERPTVLQGWMYHANLLGLLIGKLAGVRSVFWNVRCAGMEMKYYPQLSRWVVRMLCWLSHFPRVIVTNSEAGRLAHVGMGYCSEVIKVIPNGFDLEHFRPDTTAREWLLKTVGFPRDTILIGLVARYDPMKGHETFLSAIKRVRSLYPHSRFVLCGKGADKENRRLVQRIAKERLQDDVVLLGLRCDIAKITAALDIACSSSSFGEGFPNTIGEAMACEIPCVVTDVGDSAAIVGTSGKVVPSCNAEAFAVALSDLIACGPVARKKMGAEGRARITEYFEITRAASLYEELYLTHQ